MKKSTLCEYKNSTFLMGTQIEITIVSDKSRIDVNNAINESLNIFHKVVQKYTRFSDTSDLSRLNRSNGQFVEVSEELFKLIKFGITLSNKTNGLFDLTIIDLLEAYGYDNNYDFSKLDSLKLKDEINELIKTRPSYKEIDLDETNSQIKLQPKQKIDLGSIGKGFAIKLSKEFLLENNFNNFLINAGGDVCAEGKDIENKDWKAILFDPEETLKTGKFESFGNIRLKDQTLACSGPWARKVGSFHHLLNPKTGIPKKSTTPVFIKAPDPIVADAFATLLFLDPETNKDLLQEYKVEKLNF